MNIPGINYFVVDANDFHPILISRIEYEDSR